ncbi:DNA cytosine methyltransferase [Vibrio chagasii]|uniref:DNA cytosine methyltransferase n=1 Tax=Vibrio chagasii TaxID=170679 RepID=UPI003BB4ACEF
MKIVDLFSGLGGLTVGAYQAAQQMGEDFEIYLASDIDPHCKTFYLHNFEQYVTTFHGEDIVDLDVSSLKKSEIDFLFAGPPCQGNSDLNNHSRRTDEKNNLYLETLKVISHLSPKVFLIENVPTVVHAEQGVVDQVKEVLNNLYEIQDLVIDFEKLGVSQTRKRHVLIGSKYPLPADLLNRMYEGKNPSTLRDSIFDLQDVEANTLFNTPSRMVSVNRDRTNYLFDNGLYDLPNHMRPKCHQGNHSYKSMYGRLSWDKPAQTITGGFGSMGQGRYLHPAMRRVITPHEAARIQGLPDWLDFSPINKRGAVQQMIGNAVPPVLSKELIIKIHEARNELQ